MFPMDKDIGTLLHHFIKQLKQGDRKAMESYEIRWRDGLQSRYNCMWINPQVSAGQVSSMRWNSDSACRCECACVCASVKQGHDRRALVHLAWPWVTLCHRELSLAHAEHSWKRARAWGYRLWVCAPDYMCVCAKAREKHSILTLLIFFCMSVRDCFTFITSVL